MMSELSEDTASGRGAREGKRQIAPIIATMPVLTVVLTQSQCRPCPTLQQDLILRLGAPGTNGQSSKRRGEPWVGVRGRSVRGADRTLGRVGLTVAKLRADSA